MQNARKRRGPFFRKERASAFSAHPVLNIFEHVEIMGDVRIFMIELAESERCQVEQDIFVFDEADGSNIHDHVSFSTKPSRCASTGRLSRMSLR